jgi:DNA-binding winged helix-turn-helix (wHTH) protein
MTVEAASELIIRFGVFQADLASRELFRDGRKVPLQERPFQVLEMLLERRGELVTREELQQRLWPTAEFGEFDVGLNKAVAKLREALHDDASSPRFIETLPRRGYRFIERVTAASPATSADVVAHSYVP